MKDAKSLLSVSDFSIKEIEEVIKLAKEMKQAPQKCMNALLGKTIVMIFEKPSTRTRVSFECAMLQLGGHAITTSRNSMQIERGETIGDSAKVLERYVDGIVARVDLHDTLTELSSNSRIPVINGLSDLEHPCQIISDLFTVYEDRGGLKGAGVAYLGDGNNVCNSLLLGCAMTGMSLSVATPKAYAPDEGIVKKAIEMAKKTGSSIEIGNDPAKAVEGMDYVYTDVWVSMGQEDEANRKMSAFKGFQINEGLLAHAKKSAKVMHCLPAHREVEISSEVLDGKRSIVWNQAENRLHAQKALLVKLVG